MAPRSWIDWHDQYDVDGPLARRLEIVQRYIGQALEARASGPVTVISMCSGDGRDLLGVLTARGAAGARVVGRLVEQDPTLCAAARRAISDAQLDAIEVVQLDAGLSSAYAGAVPADLILACGIFGNVGDADVERTIKAMPMLCNVGATVIWTRHTRPPDLTASIRRWFRQAGFVNVAFEPVPDSVASVGVERFDGEPLPLASDLRLFDFEHGGSEQPTRAQ